MTKKIINNFDKLWEFLKFPPNTYYKFQVIKRKKDGEDVKKSSKLIKSYLVDNLGKIETLQPEMIKLCQIFNARLYVSLDRGNIIKALFNIKQYIDTQLQDCLFSKEKELSASVINRAIESSTDQQTSKNYKLWLVDIDTKDGQILYKIKDTLPFSFYLATLETKNGYHLIYERKFDMGAYFQKDFNWEINGKKLVEYKENANTLVYMEYEDEQETTKNK